MESYLAANLPNGIFSETLPNERQYFLNTSMFMSLKLQFVFTEIWDNPGIVVYVFPEMLFLLPVPPLSCNKAW